MTVIRLKLFYCNLCHQNNLFCFFRGITLEEKENIERRVILSYKDLESFLKSDKYTEDLRNELEKSNPNYLDVLQKWRRDLENSDHGIVIAGICMLIDLNFYNF